MFQVEITGPDKTVEVTVNNYLTTHDGNLDRFQDIIDTFHTAVPLSEFLFELDDEGPPAQYSLTLTALDGRTWYQLITFDVVTNPASTFVTGDHAWRLTELQPRRVLQKFLFDIVPIWSPVEIKVTWL